MEKDNIKELIERAEAGDAAAQNELGFMYRNEGKKFYEQAVEMFEKAAAQEDAESQYQLGEMYYCGEGVKQDYAKAFDLFMKLFEQKGEWCLDAASMLGNMYYYGNYVEQDYKKAFDWYEKAADDGDGDVFAVYMVGYMYYHGEGVKQNYEKAFEWLTKENMKDWDDAQSLLGCMYYFGNGVEQNYEKAFDLLEKAASKGEAEVQMLLGLMYLKGDGVKKDEEKGKILIEEGLGQIKS